MIYYINFITFNYILLIIVKMQNDYNLCKFSKFKCTAGETMGNWGFSNRISNSGQELKRLRCLFNKMDSMRTTKPMMCVKYNYLYDPEAWGTKPSPEECKPIWMTFPMRRPLITYSSTATILLTSNLNEIGTDLLYPIPGRSYVLQGTDKWYRCRQCNVPCPTPRCN